MGFLGRPPGLPAFGSRSPSPKISSLGRPGDRNFQHCIRRISHICPVHPPSAAIKNTGLGPVRRTRLPGKPLKLLPFRVRQAAGHSQNTALLGPSLRFLQNYCTEQPASEYRSSSALGHHHSCASALRDPRKIVPVITVRVRCTYHRSYSSL